MNNTDLQDKIIKLPDPKICTTVVLTCTKSISGYPLCQGLSMAETLSTRLLNKQQKHITNTNKTQKNILMAGHHQA